MENGGAQGVQFLVSIILARLLSPEEYGVVGVILIFVTIANVLVQNGFSTALIQKRKVDDTDFSSVFFFNMAVSAVIYLVLYLSAPGIAYFYNNQEMTALVRVLAVVLFPGGVISIQNAYVSRNMEFKGPVHILLCGIHDIGCNQHFPGLQGTGGMGPGMAADCILLFLHADSVYEHQLETPPFVQYSAD